MKHVPPRLLLALAATAACAAFTACGVDEDAPLPGEADDEYVGTEEYTAPDPDPAGCGDDCDDIPDNPRIEAPDFIDAEDESEDEGAVQIMATGPVAGSHMITTKYAGFHTHASSTSSLISVPPHGGVDDDALHPYRNPTGVIPAGHDVVVVDATPHSGFMKVKYAGITGYISTSKLLWKNPALSRVKLAMQPAARNAFFKHQIHRSRWNKDGPMHSGNCAPTSLAMAALVLGKETSGLSIEESIHRVRHKYDPGLHESTGTSRSEIKNAAIALGLNVHPLSTDLSPSAALTRLKGQLDLGRVVVLVGQPGKPDSGPTAYEKAFNRAYAAAIDRGESLMHSTYNYNGYHAILVLGRDSNGNYVVGDPISEVGFIAITPTEMKDFMTRWSGNRGTGNAVWR